MKMRKDRRIVLWVLGALFAVQVYFVQEMLAMAVLAGIVYLVFAGFIGGVLFLRRLGTFVLAGLAVRPVQDEEQTPVVIRD